MRSRETVGAMAGKRQQRGGGGSEGEVGPKTAQPRKCTAKGKREINHCTRRRRSETTTGRGRLETTITTKAVRRGNSSEENTGKAKAGGRRGG